MPARYHIETQPVPSRFPPVIRSGVIAWEEGCLKCAKCVKKECVYKVYEKRALEQAQTRRYPRQHLQRLLPVCSELPEPPDKKGFNPAWKAAGDDYWTPEILSTLWFQAETGRIPVSGAATAALLRRRLRCHVDGHVGNRCAHQGRHTRPGIYQHYRRPRTKGEGPSVRDRPQDRPRPVPPSRGAAAPGDLRFASLFARTGKDLACRPVSGAPD